MLAYLDAGTGSLLLQAIVGGAAAIGVTARLYWGRLKRFLRLERDEPQEQTDSRIP